jgi:hypothetical protein
MAAANRSLTWFCVSASHLSDARIDLVLGRGGSHYQLLMLTNAPRCTIGRRLHRGRPNSCSIGPEPGPEPPTAQATALPLPDKPSIAVLPFANMSGDPEQEYFADGMVEEIITALSRIRWLFVIARNSTFTYKGQAVDVKHVGRELGVHYALEVGAQGEPAGAHHRAADRRLAEPSLGRSVRRFARGRFRTAGQGSDKRRRRYRAGIAGGRDATLRRAADDRPQRV